MCTNLSGLWSLFACFTYCPFNITEKMFTSLVRVATENTADQGPSQSVFLIDYSNIIAHSKNCLEHHLSNFSSQFSMKNEF